MMAKEKKSLAGKTSTTNRHLIDVRLDVLMDVVV